MAERKRIAVPILGNDTSTPDHSVADGMCKTLNNLRYTGQAWRNVQEFVSKHMPQIDGYDILYKHPASPENMYIGVTKGVIVEKKTSYYAHREGDEENGYDVYYTKKPLDNIASSLGLSIEYLYLRGDFLIYLYPSA